MKDLIGLFMSGAIIVSLFAIAAWLVVEGHPWFALLVIAAAVTLRIRMD